MPELALAIYAVYLTLTFGVRSVLQRRATGSSGFHGISGAMGSIEWLAGVFFVVALAMGVAAPVLALADIVEPIASLNEHWLHAVGVVLALAGIALTFYAQVAMGSSWRIGVSDEERTELITHGPFALVRNPIFSAMIPTGLGLTLLVPSAVAIVGFAALVAALELQVRVVEEPYLLRAQGEAYASYAERTGRFVPGVGKLSRAA